MNRKIRGIFFLISLIPVCFDISFADPRKLEVEEIKSDDTLWSRTYGEESSDEGYSVQQTADGGYIVTGYTSSFGVGGNDVYLVKTDSAGRIIWSRTYGGTQNDRGFSVQQTEDKGYIVVGATESFGAGNSDVYLIKTDFNGDTVWTRTYGGSNYDCGRSVQQTKDFGYIVAGYTESFGAGGQDVYLIKTDSLGDILWTRTYGGSNNDWCHSVQQTMDTGYIMVGGTNSFGAGGDVYLIKTYSSGNIQWSRSYGDSNSDYGYSVQQTTDTGYIVAGYTGSFDVDVFDVYLIKIYPNGNIKWSSTYGGNGSDRGYSVHQTTDGGYIVGGFTGSLSFGARGEDTYLIKTNSEGGVVWSRIYGDSSDEEGRSVQQTADSGYVVVGYTSSFGRGLQEVMLTKLDPPGNTCIGKFVSSGEQGVLSATTIPPTVVSFPDTVGASPPDSVTSPATVVTTVCPLEPDFTIEVSPDTGTLCARDSITFEVRLTSIEGFNSPCTLSVYSLPLGVNGKFFPPVVVPTGTSTLSTSAESQIFAGIDTFTISAWWAVKGDATVHDTQVYLTTSNPPSIFVSDSATFYAEESNTLWVTASDVDPTDIVTLTTSFEMGSFIQTDSLGGEASGFLTWTPSPGDTNSPHPATFFASDHHCALAIDTSWVTVIYYNHPPQFDSCPFPRMVFVGDTVRFTISASDPDSADTLTIFMWSEFGEFPNGKKGKGTVKGEFVWVPDSTDTQYTHYAEFLVTDPHQAQDTCMVAITVVSNHPPQFDSCPSPKTVFVGDTVRFTISALDPDSADTLLLYRFPISFGTFPDGQQGIGRVKGEFVWVPDTADTQGTRYVWFYVYDQHQAQDTCTVAMEIRINHPPVINLDPPFSDTIIYEGQTLRFRVCTTDPDGDSIILDTLNVPLNATFIDSGNGAGVFTFNPDSTQADTYYVTFLARDTGNLADSELVAITVNNVNRAPTLDSIGSKNVDEGQTLQFRVYATDPDGDSIILDALNVPANAVFVDSGNGAGSFTFNPDHDQVGNWSVTFIAKDIGGLADSELVTIAVENETLKVVGHFPDTNEADVLIDTHINIILSEPVKFWTVDSSTFRVESKRDGVLNGTYTPYDDSTRLEFSPSASLFSLLDTITVTLTTGIKDLGDSGMAHDTSWEFYTGLGVYPGNTNNDTIVDERDILPLGLYWEKRGPSREEKYQDRTWSIKPAHRWTADSSWNPFSAVYADADGNGVVDVWDICAVSDNWERKIFNSPQRLRKSINLTKTDHQKYLSFYEKIYNALIDCPESKGKNQIKEFLEGILEKKSKPSKFEVSQNYPNPFNSTTVIKYSLPKDCQVEINLFNISGQKVKTLVNEYQTSGYKKVTWDGKDDQEKEVGSGIYFYQMKAQSFSCTQKLLFLK